MSRPLLTDLGGTVLKNEKDWPLKPYPTEAMPNPHGMFDTVRFSIEEWEGEVSLGWTGPLIRKNSQTRRIVEYRGWQPYGRWVVTRQEGSASGTLDGSGAELALATAFQQMLDPSFALIRTHKYQLTRAFVDALDHVIRVECGIAPPLPRRVVGKSLKF